MSQTKILIIGKNSFLAKSFLQICKNSQYSITSCSHDEIPKDFSGYQWIINFSINPKFFSEPYSINIDQDAIISKAVTDYPQLKYALISSRAVYPSNNTITPIREDQELTISNQKQYGLNKIQSEKTCKSVLQKEQLLIVRASNIFGFEYGRHTFMGIAQKRLLTKSEILLDIAKETRRDFIPATAFSKYLLKLIEGNHIGVYNIGSGIPLKLADICNAIFEGYGAGELKILDGAVIKDQFVLDTNKLIESTSYKITAQEILQYCKTLGIKLKKVRYETK